MHAGNIDTAGAILANAVSTTTELVISGAVKLSGGGKVELSNNSGNASIAGGTAATLINVDNVIAGAGTIGSGGLTQTNSGAG